VVHRSVRAGPFPERAPTGRRQSKLAPSLPYLRQRWEHGCQNGLQLARELQAQGFRGSASLVGKLTSDWRARLPEPAERIRGKKRQAAPQASRRLSPRQASWLLVKDQAQLTADQRALSEHLCHEHANLQELYQLGQDFVMMVKQRQARRLDAWLAQAHQSSSVELQGFASGIKRDYAAVQAALSLPWSQGQVEGPMTRLKFLKRQMYGRAHFACFARASYAELDPATTQSAHEPHSVYKKHLRQIPLGERLHGQIQPPFGEGQAGWMIAGTVPAAGSNS
jgi:transposase